MKKAPPFALPLEDVRPDHLPLVGAKAAHLATLMGSGLPVPPGFCITTSAFREDPRNLGRVVKGANRWGYPVAVRSSATAEDLPDLSFAGQHDTFLDVGDLRGCVRAIRDCWSSLWTDRAVTYRERAGIDSASVEMAVLIQPMVFGEVSGVLFSADPVTGRRDRMVLEACPGLGEALVSGEVTPDRVVLSRPGGEVLRREGADPPCLEEGCARALGQVALRAEGILGFPVDMEWTVADGKIWVLQARPITALPERVSLDGRQVWTNMNTGEVLPDVVTPMTWSMLEPVAVKLIATIFAKVGLHLEGYPLLARRAGRAYFNLNTLTALARRIPGGDEKGLRDLLGGRQEVMGALEIPDEDVPDLRIPWMRVLQRTPGTILEVLTYGADRKRRVHARMRRAGEEALRIDPRSLTEEGLVRAIRGILDGLVRSDVIYDLLSVVTAYQSALFEACRRWFGEEGPGLASRLQSGLGGNESAAAGVDLWKLSLLARRSPESVGSLLRGEVPDEPVFRVAWEAFLRDHGHHCRGELELKNPRWSEDPREVLANLRSYLRSREEEDFLRRYGRLRREREAAAAECRKRIRNPLKWILFEFLRSRTQLFAPMRENIKSQAVRRLAAMRGLLLELGDRLVRRGILRDREDVFFLDLSELSAPEGRPVDARRAEYEANLAITPPPIIVGRFHPDRVEPDRVDGGRRTFSGVAANPGVVTGTARVILRAGEGEVEPGEILVAPFTDPGWSPYFLNAAAIVMDMGGILSHGTIIAREYGIPAVVNVGPATRVIRTGQRIRVDGDRGRVTILE